MKTTSLIAWFGVGLCTLQANAQKNKSSKKMNVLFIAIDDLKPALGAYGDPIAVTPNMDRLAAQGAIFQNCYVQQAVSGASRASILTGMRPDKTKVWDLITDFRQVNPNAVSIPQYFKQNGYETVARGKIYHQGSVGKGHDAPSWSQPYVPTKAPTYMDIEVEKGEKGPSTQCVEAPDNAFIDGKLAEEGVKLLGDLSKGDKPFFLAVGFIRPHLPFVAPKRYWDLYRRQQFQPAPFQNKAANSPDIAYHSAGELKGYTDIPKFNSFSDNKNHFLGVDKQLELIHGYYAATSYTDAQVGKLLDELQRLGLAENTIVVLWGDHGWHLGDHGLWNKHSNFEQATRACLLMRVPRAKQGVKPVTQCEFVDVFPTLCDLTGLPTPKYLDGLSLKPAIVNPDAVVHKYAMSQYYRPNGVMGYSIRTNRYRYTEWIGNWYDAEFAYNEKEVVARELYDYENDSLETRSLIDDPEYKEVQIQMQKLFVEAITREHEQYVSYAKIASYQEPINVDPKRNGREVTLKKTRQEK